MNFEMRKHLLQRESILEDQIEELEEALEELNGTLEAVQNALGKADMDDLNRQYERSV